MRDLNKTTVTASGHEDTVFEFEPWRTIPSGHETKAYIDGEQVGIVRRYEVSRFGEKAGVLWEFQSTKNLLVYSGTQLNFALRDWIKDHD